MQILQQEGGGKGAGRSTGPAPLSEMGEPIGPSRRGPRWQGAAGLRGQLRRRRSHLRVPRAVQVPTPPSVANTSPSQEHRAAQPDCAGARSRLGQATLGSVRSAGSVHGAAWLPAVGTAGTVLPWGRFSSLPSSLFRSPGWGLRGDVPSCRSLRSRNGQGSVVGSGGSWGQCRSLGRGRALPRESPRPSRSCRAALPRQAAPLPRPWSWEQGSALGRRRRSPAESLGQGGEQPSPVSLRLED